MSHPTPLPTVHQPSAPPDPQGRTRNGCLTAVAWIILSGLLVVLAIRPALHYYVLYVEMDSSRRAEWQTLTARLRAPLTFPAHWLNPPLYDPGTLAKFDQITTEVKTHWGPSPSSHFLRDHSFHALYGELHGPGTIPADAQATLTATLADGRRLLELTSETVHRPDYEMGMAFGGLFSGGRLPQMRMATLAGIAARLEPDPGTAMQYALLPLKQAKHHPASSFYNRMASNRLAIIGTESVASIALRTSDVTLLRSTMDSISILRDQALSSSSSLPAVGLEAIGRIRHLRGTGFSIRAEPGESSYDYFIHGLRVDMRNAPERDLRPFKRSQIDVLAMLVNMFWPDQLIAKMKDTEDQYDETLEPLALARYDLTLLLLAQRIAEIEGRTVSSIRDLVPEYLPAPLLDPYTSRPYPFQLGLRRFYSFGPDGDQHAKAFDYGNQTGDVTVPNFSETTSTLSSILGGF